MDYDGDGDLDLITGSDDCCDTDRVFFLFRRDRQGRFQARKSIPLRFGTRISRNWRTRVGVSDWNQDGQLDLIIHRNEARGLLLAPGPLADRTEIETSRRIPGSEPIRLIFTKPNIIDWDRDGLPDVLVGMTGPEGRGVYLLRGVEDAEGTQLAAPEWLIAPPNGAKVTGLDVADWDGDGVSDVIFGVTWPVRIDRAPRGKRSRSQFWVYRRIPPD